MWYRLLATASILLMGSNVFAQELFEEEDDLKTISDEQWKVEQRREHEALRRDLKKPFRFWLNELSADSPDRRKQAAKVLSEAADVVSRDDMEREWFSKHPPSVVPVYVDLFEAEARVEVAARFRRSIRAALPELIERLKTRYLASLREPSDSPDERVDALCDCIAASYADGAGILQAKRALPVCSFSDSIFLPAVFERTMRTAPTDKPLYPLVLRFVRELSPRSRTRMDSTWQKIVRGEPQFGVEWDIGVMVALSAISDRDRAQLELPLFRELLKPAHPDLLRAFCLRCLSGLGSEAESMLPEVERIMRAETEARFMRELAAHACVALAIDDSRLEDIADTVGHKGKDRIEFIKFSKQQIERDLWYSSPDTFRDASMVSNFRGLLRGNGSMKRRTLRILRHHGPAARDLLPDAKKLLQDPESETRRFAKLAVEAITKLEGVRPKAEPQPQKP